MANSNISINLSTLAPAGDNIKAGMVDGMLVLVIDPTKNLGPSSSGKMIMTASTGGFVALEGGLKANINIGKKNG